MSLKLKVQLASVGVVGLIAFLGYGSQLFFAFKPPALEPAQAFLFNVLVACVWICYIRACFTDAGHVPVEWTPRNTKEKNDAENNTIHRQRWCRKCKALKPPRSHHCKTCQRCIPKMDHHCPWTINCVSHRTFPHFFRFLFYAVASMAYLEYLLYTRVVAIWNLRHLPSYLGPSPSQMALLFVFSMVNSLTLFALGILLVRNAWSLGANVTTIESWEIERHEAIIKRAKVLGGYLDGPDGIRVKITRQEFPYDIGIFRNIQQAMGKNAHFWLWPFAPTPLNRCGLWFETNGFEDSSTSWPPPDPDRIPRQPRASDRDASLWDNSLTNKEQIAAFHQRQRDDLKRFPSTLLPISRRKPFHERAATNDYENEYDSQGSISDNQAGSGEEAWRNPEGDKLHDFGVDEVAEFYDEDEVPLATLLDRLRNNKNRF